MNFFVKTKRYLIGNPIEVLSIRKLVIVSVPFIYGDLISMLVGLAYLLYFGGENVFLLIAISFLLALCFSFLTIFEDKNVWRGNTLIVNFIVSCFEVGFILALVAVENDYLNFTLFVGSLWFCFVWLKSLNSRGCREQ